MPPYGAAADAKEAGSNTVDSIAQDGDVEHRIGDERKRH
jgi:hypothetical protein